MGLAFNVLLYLGAALFTLIVFQWLYELRARYSGPKSVVVVAYFKDSVDAMDIVVADFKRQGYACVAIPYNCDLGRPPDTMMLKG